MKKKSTYKIAVTGAGGFLGSAALEFFSLDPQITEIRALFSKNQTPNLLPKVVPIVGELRSEMVCQTLLKGVDAVLHFANRGFPSDREKDPAKLIGNNLVSTDQLLQTMRQLQIPKLIFASSGGAVYQESKNRKPFQELDPTVARTPYAATKLISEYAIQEFSTHFSIDSCILRISNPFGLGQLNRTRQGFIGVLLGKLLRHEPMKIWSSLDIVKDFIYIDDVLSAFDSVLKSPKPVSGIYNLGSGVGTSLMEVIQTIEKVTERQVPFELAPNPLPENLWTVLDCSKLNEATGWQCLHSIEDGIEELWDHLISQIEEKAA